MLSMNRWSIAGVVCTFLTIILVVVFAFVSPLKDKTIPSMHVWGLTAIIGGVVSTMMLVTGFLWGRYCHSAKDGNLKHARFGYKHNRMNLE